jgi:hypothetical protein
VRYLSTDEATDTVRIWTEHESDPLVEANKAGQNSIDHSSRKFAKVGPNEQVMYKVGTIAPWEMKDLVDRQILTWGGKILDNKAFNKWLMDPEYKYLRQAVPLKLGA